MPKKYHEVIYIHKNHHNEYFKEGKKPKKGMAYKVIYAKRPNGVQIGKNLNKHTYVIGKSGRKYKAYVRKNK